MSSFEVDDIPRLDALPSRSLEEQQLGNAGMRNRPSTVQYVIAPDESNRNVFRYLRTVLASYAHVIWDTTLNSVVLANIL